MLHHRLQQLTVRGAVQREYVVGSSRFERQPEVLGGKNVLEFDSSADRAITRAFGWEEGSMELREIERTDSKITYEVLTRDHRSDPETPKPLLRRGILMTRPRAEIRRRQDQNLPMSPRFG